MAVMAAAPPGLAGTASATMNALRQMGMTLGVAFLGALMSSEAMRKLVSLADAQGISGATHAARQAITHGVASSGSPVIEVLYGPAMEHGFHVAMAGAGLACAIAVVLLMTIRRER